MKRALDLVASGLGLLVLSPLIGAVAIAIWLQDYRSPFYVAWRTGRGGQPFRMVKFRSMLMRADRTGVDSTAVDDTGITTVGRVYRRLLLVDVPQFSNGLKGQRL